MKLTKEQETAARKVYEKYWDSYTRGDLKAFSSTLDDAFEMIGTSETEVWHGKKEGIACYKAQMKELVGRAEMRNRKISVKLLKGMFLFNETHDLYILSKPKWVFYSKIRVSTLLHETPSGWKVIQQHGSIPDLKVQEGETLAFAKISKENLELRNAIKRATVQLENKNRELEIEMALEKVRAVAMGMKKADDMLHICKIISQQLRKLGVKEIRNIQTAIFNKNGTYMNYEYYDKHKKTIVTEVDYTGNKVHKDQQKFARTMMKRKGAFYTQRFSGQKLNDWYAYQKTTNQLADRFLLTAHSLSYYWFSLGPVALGISTYYPLTKEELNLFMQFRNVFGLAYRRYLDIEKAGAQAREAQVEAALEKVRAQAMGMRKPDDMLAICQEISRQLSLLGVKEIRNVQTAIFYPRRGSYMNYQYYTKHDKSIITDTVYTDHKIAREFAAKMLKGKGKLSVTHIRGRQELRNWIAYQKGTNVFIDTYLHTATSLSYYWYSLGPVALGISTYLPLNKDNQDLFKRFLNVFELSYRRYLDIEKAEAQAREAQIEAALERIRAASLAMQDSSALSEIIYKLYGELTKLDAQLDRCFIMIVNPDNRGITWWMAGHEGLLAENGFFVQMNQYPSHLMYLDNCKKRKKKWTYLFEGKEKRDWDRFGFTKTELAKLPEPVKAFMAAAKKVHLSGSSDQFGSLVTGSFEPLPEEQQEIISRFAIAFNQAYIRFLDLQKAEAQAREAQIEAALERVRAKAMAMHNSEDIAATVEVFFKELKNLGITPIRCGVGQIDEETKTSNLSATTSSKQGDSYEVIGKLKLDGHPVLEKIFTHWKKQEEYYPVLKGEELTHYYKTMNPQVGFPDYPEDAVQYGSYFYFKEGLVFAWTEDQLSEEAIRIFHRFTSVIALAYRRYMDLKEAEAQAREAQIEAALERVRSRSMAMHKSEELKEVIRLVLDQFIQLKINAEHAGFYIDYKAHADMHIWLADPNIEPFFAIIPYFDTPTWNSFLEAKAKGIPFHTDLLNFKEKNKFYQSLFKLFTVPEDAKKFYLECKGLAVSTVLLDNVGLYIENFSAIPYTDEENAVLMRFGKVFQQTYTRFLDLQKAEAQAREAQIELGLERVRARAMAMQHSDELGELVGTVFKELTQLGFKLTSSIIWINDHEQASNTLWIASAQMNKPAQPYRITPFYGDFFSSIIHAWKAQDPKWVYTLSGSKKKSFEKAFFRELPGLPVALKKALTNPKQVVFSASFNSFGALEIVETEPLTDAKFDILHRFGKVFNASYTRFNDLKKAEAQAREAQIETALERIRARALAMHSSEELLEVAGVMRQQMGLLGQPELESSIVHLYNGDAEEFSAWYAFSHPGGDPGKIITGLARAPKNSSQWAREVMKNYQSQQTEYTIVSRGKKLKEWYRVVEKLAPETVEYDAAGQLVVPPVLYYHFSKFSGGALLVISNQAPSRETRELLKRAAAVFELAYTRFLDLEKAEAQAREAQIEAALERVRSRSMAMHKSEELSDLSLELVKQVQALGVATWFCAFNIYDDDPLGSLEWGSNGQGVFPRYRTPREGIFLRYYEAGQRGEKLLINEIGEDECPAHYAYLCSLPGVGEQLLAMKEAGLPFPVAQIDHVAFFKYGYILFITYEPVPETHDIFKRFAKVFEQTYTRFLDLQKAEKQARENQIQLALERVRARTMAMQHSNELPETSQILFQQMKELGEPVEQLSIGIVHEENNVIEISATLHGDTLKKTYWHSIDEPYMMNKVYKAWETHQKTLVVELRGDELNAYNKYRNELTNSEMFPTNLGEEHQRIVYAAFFQKGMLALGANEARPPESLQLLERFASVFDLTYTRFLDLKKAEAQAREAQIEAALEKVRSRSLAMQQANELTEVAELLRKEMGQLGVEELETSSIYIVDKENEQAECWYAIKDIREENKNLVSDEMTITFADTRVGSEMGRFYRGKKDQISIVMKGDNRKEWINYCAGKSKVLQGYYGDEVPERTYHLVKFNGGYMGAASPGAISAESWDLLRRAASVFSLAYTRFNDLKIAEAHALQAEKDLIAIKEAKQKAEEALGELQATQKQLIQSEKMASLGELTAGIAHEIQNPLNFVNNFSEVSKELLDEMKEELDKGNVEDAKGIMNDVIQNLEKINHHGKRADGIVKGMLQHSRSSSGHKELADINALADEYLRLAYHGLRAKDKSFNAKFETDFDSSLGKIEIMAQDMGRVILNLINNAFYAVNERKTLRQAQGDSYEPAVTIGTKKYADRVEIFVKDNGSGIPPKVLDKIFQPFFTTKPTGQGTGLGLSLAYDIVKAHGGELRVETKPARTAVDGEREGTTFIINLPLQ